MQLWGLLNKWENLTSIFGNHKGLKLVVKDLGVRKSERGRGVLFIPDFCFRSREIGFPLHRVQLDISSTLHHWDLASDISWHSRAASPSSEVKSIFGAKHQHSFTVSAATSEEALPA